MDRLFIELSSREDEVAQAYGKGLEVKEVAALFFRSVATIRNQLQSIYAKLEIRNRSELSIKLMERRFGVRLTVDFSPVGRAIIACSLILILCFNGHVEMRRQRTMRPRTNLELSFKVKTATRGRGIPFAA